MKVVIIILAGGFIASVLFFFNVRIKRRKIGELKESKHRLTDVIIMYRLSEVKLHSEIDKAKALNEYYRLRNKELREELHHFKVNR